MMFYGGYADINDVLSWLLMEYHGLYFMMYVYIYIYVTS